MRLVLSYTCERLLTAGVAAAIALVTLGAQIVRRWHGLDTLAVDLLLTSLLVVAFRIGDDIFDRERDRARYPNRVAVRAETIDALAIVAACIWSSAAALVTLLVGIDALGLLLALTLWLAAWYRLRGPRSAMGERTLLLKYPVFLAVLTGPGPALSPRGLLTAVVVYLTVCAYEWVHDAESPVLTFGGVR
jgi:4-hydroxybenzoate polyprenyltransferase